MNNAIRRSYFFRNIINVTMKKPLISLIITLGIIFFSNLISAEVHDSLLKKVNYYKNKYKVNCLNQKITDNFGNGNNSLYGTRNMKPILHGIAYRGGANNFYHKTNKRDNHNPLPLDGLFNLTEQGFSKAVYLYSKNFSKTDTLFISKNGKDTLRYYQNSGNDSNGLRSLLEMVYQSIKEPDTGPVYLHCWNGWHQSGYIAAAILMQFCDFTNDMALDYWIENTDGASKGYENVKSRIKNFVPFDNMPVDKEIKSMICPCVNQ